MTMTMMALSTRESSLPTVSNCAVETALVDIRLGPGRVGGRQREMDGGDDSDCIIHFDNNDDGGAVDM